MAWTEIALEGEVVPDELKRACVDVGLATSLHEVLVVEDIVELERARSHAVSCVSVRVGGQFPQHITICLRDADPPEECRSVQALVDRLGCRCLIGDDSPDPFRWILLTPDGKAQVVSVDPGALDRDELTIASGA